MHDPYGDLDPIQWATRRLYVPELALGRLVESPTQIIAQLDGLDDAGLKAVEEFESAHGQRKTVLREVDHRLQAEVA